MATTMHSLPIGPDLLAATGERIVRLLGHPTTLGLSAAFREIVAEARHLDLTDDVQYQLAVALADELMDWLAAHLVFAGQHPHPDNHRTVADWLLGASLAGIQAELFKAAMWSYAELIPERLR